MSVIRPQERITTLSTPALRSGFTLDSFGLAIPEGRKENGARVLIPEAKEIATFVQRGEAKTIDSAEELHYLASSWDFFDKRLKKAGVTSPVAEIQERAAKGGFDAAMLDFNNWQAGEKQKGTIAPEFYNFLEESVDFVCEMSDNPKVIDTFFSYLTVLVETQLYRNRNYKLDQPWHQEKMIETLAQHGVVATEKIADFFSYFNSPDSLKRDLLLILPETLHHPLRPYLLTCTEKAEEREEVKENIGIEIEGIPLISVGPEAHPGFEMGKDGGETMPELRRAQAKIGYNSDFKKDLFELWYYAKMARFVGSSVHIHIDNTNDPRLFRVMQRTFGYTVDDVTLNRPGNKATIEIRLNLPFYDFLCTNGHDHREALVESPKMDQKVYDLRGLIETIIRLKEEKDTVQFAADGRLVFYDKEGKNQENPFVGQGLEPFWELRFRDRLKKSFDQIEKTSAGGENVTGVFYQIMDVPKGVLSREQVDRWSGNGKTWLAEMIKKMEPGMLNQETIEHYLAVPYIWDDIFEAIVETIAQGTVTADLALRLLSNNHSHQDTAEMIIQKLAPGLMTVAWAEELVNIYKKRFDLAVAVIEALPKEAITIALAQKMVSLSKEKTLTIASVLQKLPAESISKSLAEEWIILSRNNYGVIQGVIKKMKPSDLSRTYIDDLVKKFGKESVLNRSLLECVLPENISPKMLEYYFDDKERFMSGDMDILLKKIVPGTMNQEEAEKLISTYGKSRRLVEAVVRRLPAESLSAEAAKGIASLTGRNPSMIHLIMEKIAVAEITETVVEDFFRISGHSPLVAIKAIELLGSQRLTTAMADRWVELTNSGRVAAMVVEQLPLETLTWSRIGRYFGWSYLTEEICKAVIKRRGGDKLDVGMAVTLLDLSTADDGVLLAVIDHIDPRKLTKKLLERIVNQSQNQDVVVRALLGRLEGNSSPSAFRKVVYLLGKIEFDYGELASRVTVYDHFWGKTLSPEVL